MDDALPNIMYVMNTTYNKFYKFCLESFEQKMKLYIFNAFGTSENLKQMFLEFRDLNYNNRLKK